MVDIVFLSNRIRDVQVIVVTWSFLIIHSISESVQSTNCVNAPSKMMPIGLPKQNRTYFFYVCLKHIG